MLMISDRGKRRRADLIKSPKYGGPLVNAFFAIRFVYPRENGWNKSRIDKVHR